MPLLPFARCDVPEPETECDYLFETGQSILDVALGGLAPFIPASDCDEFTSFVSLGEPKAEFYDALTVHLIDLVPTKPTEGAAGQTFYTGLTARWGLRLWENQYPGVEEVDGRLVVPAPDKIEKINQHLYAHGAAIYSALLAAIAQPEQFEYPHQIVATTIGPLMPLGGIAGTAAGWSVAVNTEIG